ncbi:hypothetical protein GQ600_24038 [Phytophthora cactorum]|nr:hypothetical protein GQ600_24038 [Phytophthora cactorum]
MIEELGQMMRDSGSNNTTNIEEDRRSDLDPMRTIQYSLMSFCMI